MSNIGDPVKEVEYEPIPESAPIPERVPSRPAIPAPSVPEKEPVPA